MLGQNAISSAAMGFDAYLADNCAFVQENEMLRYIEYIKEEADAYEISVKGIFDPFHAPEDTVILNKLLNVCTFKVTDSLKETLMTIIHNLTENEKILLYYKNNLYAFCDTPIMHDCLVRLHTQIPELKVPSTNGLSKEAIETLEFVWKMMYAFVVFDHPIYDRVRKNKYTYKKAVGYQDTDSNFLILGPWVNYVKTKVIPGDVPKNKEDLKQFDFKVVNIMTLFLTRVVTCSFATLCKSLNIDDEHSKQLSMKNEFYFSRILFTTKKKRYLARPLLQEGNEIPYPKDLEIKGFDFIKNTTKASIREFYETMTYNDILIPEKIDNADILVKIMLFEDSLRKALRNGDSQYFKQSNIKSQREYANPYSIQGIKGVLLWNTLCPDYAIQLPSDVDIIPITLENGRRKMTTKIGQTVESSVWSVPIGVDESSGKRIYMNNSGKEMVQFADRYPEEFEKLKNEILLNPNNAIKTMGLNVIAKPKNSEIPIPEWFYEIMDMDKIVNDALKLFNPIMRSLGISVPKSGPQTEHYSNIVEL